MEEKLMKNRLYYVLEMRYKKNGFLMDELAYYRSQKRAMRRCAELNAELEELNGNGRFVMIDRPFIGKGCVNFGSSEVYYEVSDLRKRMLPEKRKYKSWNNMKELFELLNNIFDEDNLEAQE